MKAERLKNLESLFFAAQEYPRAERAARVQQLCGGDAALAQELLQLLAAQEQAEQTPTLPAVEAVAQQIAQASPPLPVLEHYEILQPLGRGGMGEVFLARDKRLKRKVALKFLVPAFAADHERRRRFEQEALLASALNHPNILTVYEIGAINETCFIATEFVAGETLRQRLRQAPLAEAEAVNIALQMAAALQAAHQAGIIHRDIKPENIMVRPDGIVKVLDFGIAKSTQPKASGTETLPLGMHTATGQIIGTPAYIAPEQLRGLKLDGRSDLFSLGVVLYEMLMGAPPFTGTTVEELLLAILQQEIVLPTGGTLAPALAATVTKALHKAPEARFQTAAEFIQALQQTQSFAPTQNLLRQETDAGTRWRQSRPRPLHFGLALLFLLCLLGGVAGWHYGRSTPATPPAQTPTPIELLRFSVEVSRPQTASLFTNGTAPLAANQDFKFHFTAQTSGYLYIVAPGQRNIPQTFLTARPVPPTGNSANQVTDERSSGEWGVYIRSSANQLIAERPFAFPVEKDIWLGLNETLTTTFTMIFSTQPLLAPAFLAAPAGHELTLQEQAEWEVFKQQHGVQPVVPASETEPRTPPSGAAEAWQRRPAQIIVAPQPIGAPQLVIFDVTLKQQ